MLVQDIMSEAELVLSPGETVGGALKECAGRDLFIAPVVDGGKYRGMFKISSALGAGEAELRKPVVDVLDTGFPVVLKDTLVIDIPKDFKLFLPVVDSDKNFLGVIRSADILNSYEKGVHYSLSSLRSLIDSTNNGIVAVNKNGVINIFNASARLILGMEGVSAVGMNIVDVLPKTRLPWILKTRRPEFNVKTEIAPDKTLFANYSPIMNNGEIIGAVAVFQDFSELESISEELNRVKSLNRQLDAIINSSYDGIWITDHNGTTLRVNDAIERITGLPREKCIGRNMRDMELDGTVDELPLEMQVKLLRVLQEQEIMRIGGLDALKVDVRVIAATNKDISQLTREGRFREDLYYRLNVVPIDIPPLRERPEDISALISHYLYIFNNKFKTKKVIDSETVDHLMNYSWPGNVRELINIIERLVITTPGDLITFADLPANIKTAVRAGGGQRKAWEFMPLKKALDQYERDIIMAAMELYGSTRKVARVLEISQSTVSRRIRKINSK